MTHPAVADSAVIGAPDERAGELPRAYVVLKPNLHVSEDELQKFIAGKSRRHFYVAKQLCYVGGDCYYVEITSSFNVIHVIACSVLRMRWCCILRIHK